MKDSILTRFNLPSPIVLKSLLRSRIEQNHARVLDQPPLWRHRQLRRVRRSCHNLKIILFTHSTRQKPTLALTQPQSPHFCSSIQDINAIKVVNTRQHITRFVYIMTLTTVAVIANVHLLSPRLAHKLGVINARVNNSSHNRCRQLINNSKELINFK
jgi:hypothetical protein